MPSESWRSLVWAGYVKVHNLPISICETKPQTKYESLPFAELQKSATNWNYRDFMVSLNRPTEEHKEFQ